MEGAGREPGCRAAAAPARALEGQEPGWDPPELPSVRHPKLASLPGEAAGAAALRFVPLRAALFSAGCGGQRWSPCRLGRLILFHIAERLHHVTVWSQSGQRRAEPSFQIHPLASRPTPRGFLWSGGSSWGAACRWRLGTGHSDELRFLPLRGFLETQVCRFYARFVSCVEETCQRFRR